MLKKLHSVPALAKLGGTPIPLTRALIDGGVVDAFITDNGWRCGDDETVRQIKEYRANKAANFKGKKK